MIIFRPSIDPKDLFINISTRKPEIIQKITKKRTKVDTKLSKVFISFGTILSIVEKLTINS